MTKQEESARPGAERRLKELGIKPSPPPQPFATYVEAVETGNLLFLRGMLPTEAHTAKFVGRVGTELDAPAAREAAQLSAPNVFAVARQHLGSFDRVTLEVSVGTVGDIRDQPNVADGASELDAKRFWERTPSAWYAGSNLKTFLKLRTESA